MAFACCLQCCVLFSASMICITASCHRKFCPLSPTFCSLNCVNFSITFHHCNHETHNTIKTSPITVSSIHRLLTFVNAMHKDITDSCFRVPAAGANATRNMAQWKNWFFRNHPAVNKVPRITQCESPLRDEMSYDNLQCYISSRLRKENNAADNLGLFQEG